MAPIAKVVHKTKDRLRVRVPSMKGKTWYFEKLNKSLSSRGDVREVWINPATGSALIIHDTGLESLIEHGKASGLYDLNAPKPSPKTLYDEVAGVFGGWNRDLKRMSGGHIDIPSLVFLGLVVSGVYQIMRGRVTAPAWYTAFWYALGVFSKGQVQDWDSDDEIEAPVTVDTDMVGDAGE
jgi:hypothetical protein